MSRYDDDNHDKAFDKILKDGKKAEQEAKRKKKLEKEMKRREN